MKGRIVQYSERRAQLVYGATVIIQVDGSGNVFVRRFEKPEAMKDTSYVRVYANCLLVRRAKEMAERSLFGWEAGHPAGRIVVKEKDKRCSMTRANR